MKMLRNLALVSLLIPTLAWAEPPQCRAIRNDLLNCQVELAVCKNTCQLDIQTAPEIVAATVGTNPVTIRVSATVTGPADWIIQDRDESGARVIADWLFKRVSPTEWDVTFTSVNTAQGTGRGALRVVTTDGVTYLYPIRVEVR